MKFKTSNEIKHENINCSTAPISNFNTGICIGVTTSFESFSERIKFYKEYESNPMKLEKEKEEEYQMMLKDYHKFYNIKTRVETEAFFIKNPWYNSWLFRYCFGDLAND